MCKGTRTLFPTIYPNSTPQERILNAGILQHCITVHTLFKPLGSTSWNLLWQAASPFGTSPSECWKLRSKKVPATWTNWFPVLLNYMFQNLRFPEVGVPQIIHFNGIFHYRPSILDTPMAMEPPWLSVDTQLEESGWSLALRWRCRSSRTTQATPPTPKVFFWLTPPWLWVAPWRWPLRIAGRVSSACGDDQM